MQGKVLTSGWSNGSICEACRNATNWYECACTVAGCLYDSETQSVWQSSKVLSVVNMYFQRKGGVDGRRRSRYGSDNEE